MKNTGSHGNSKPRNKKSLEKLIEQIPPLQKPSPWLEQHTTPAWIAADIVWDLTMKERLADSIIVDMGAGTGRLCLGALIAGAGEALAVEIDPKQIWILVKTTKKLGLEGKTHIILADARKAPLRNDIRAIVIMNPPFGTTRRKADLEFLGEAMRFAMEIYSLHLSNPSVRAFLAEKAREKGYILSRIKTYKMELKQVFSYHDSRIRRIPVDLLWFRRTGS